MNIDKIVKWVIRTVIALALAAFLLSFNATAHEAGERFAGEYLRWLVPLIIEGAMVVFLAVAYVLASLGESRRLVMGLVVMFTGLSVVINVSHATYTQGAIADNLLTGIMAAVPPLSLFLAFEALVSLITITAKRSSSIETLTDLKQAVAVANRKLSALKDEITVRHEQVEKLNRDISDAKKVISEMRAEAMAEINEETAVLREKAQAEYETEKAALDEKLDKLRSQVSDAESQQLDVSKQMLLMYVKNNPLASQADISQVIGRSPSTVSKYVRELTSAKMLHKNGQGWEVVS